MKGRHTLAVGIEGDLVNPRQPFLDFVTLRAGRCGMRAYRRLCRVADQSTVSLALRVAAERHGGQQPGDTPVVLVARVEIEYLPASGHHVDMHLVLGERTRLVRANGRNGAERLNRRQGAHKRVVTHHLARAERQGDCDDRG